jgi:uncharacterized protein DUF5946
VERVSDPEIPVEPWLLRLSEDLVPCVGCGALVPNTDGPTNANIGGSPGCWAIYETVRARGIGDHRYAELQQLTADTYAVQHPAVSRRGSTQSVAPHLIGLCALVERALPASVAIAAVHNAVKSRDSFESLAQPESCGELTILHVRDATTLQEHVRRLREWSSSVWKAWSQHHRVIGRWTAEALRRAQPGERSLTRFFSTRRP